MSLIVMRFISKIIWQSKPKRNKENKCMLAHSELTVTRERARMWTAKFEGGTKTGVEIKLVEMKPEGKIKMGVEAVVQGNAQGKAK
eukprot:3762746-Ditylum_brightwellii.AAC.1